MPCATVVQLTTDMDVRRAIQTSPNLVVIDFYAHWCGPCKVLAPVMGALAARHPTVDVYKVDVDQLSAIADQLSVTSLPTILLFKAGIEVARIVGADKTVIEAAVVANK